jgi:hypothetical protein
MKCVWWALPLLFAVEFASSQSVKPAASPDLSKLPSEQLKACQEKSQFCGTKDSLAINNELANRLDEYTIDQVLACYDDWKICGVEESRPTGWPISDYLASRGDPHDLLVRYWRERKWIIRNGIERVAYHFDTPEVTAFMQRVVRERKYDGEDLYWPANFLAKQCDAIGLNWLRNGRGRNQGGMQYQTTLELFGKCDYRPAIPLLVEELDDFSGNIISASEDSLDTLYSDHPENLETLESIQKYYCGRAKQEGFKVNCDSK